MIAAGVRKKAPVFLLVLILFVALPPAANWAVFKRLEKRLDLRIEGRFAPVPFAPVFYLKNTRFEWKGKVFFENGDLKVDYRPLSFFSSEGMRTRLSGKNLDVRLLGDWAMMQGVEKAHLEKFDADFSLGRKGLNEIYYLQVESDVFQFHIKKSANNNLSG